MKKKTYKENRIIFNCHALKFFRMKNADKTFSFETNFNWWPVKVFQKFLEFLITSDCFIETNTTILRDSKKCFVIKLIV